MRKRDGRENCKYMGAVSYKDMFAPPPLSSPPPNAIRRAAGLLAPLPPPPPVSSVIFLFGQSPVPKFIDPVFANTNKPKTLVFN